MSRTVGIAFRVRGFEESITGQMRFEQSEQYAMFRRLIGRGAVDATTREESPILLRVNIEAFDNPIISRIKFAEPSRTLRQ